MSYDEETKTFDWLALCASNWPKGAPGFFFPGYAYRELCLYALTPPQALRVAEAALAHFYNKGWKLDVQDRKEPDMEVYEKRALAEEEDVARDGKIKWRVAYSEALEKNDQWQHTTFS